MALSTRIEKIDRSILFTPGWGLSPQERAAALAEFAQQVITEAQAENTEALGAVPELTVAVDGMIGRALRDVKPEGTIVATFNLALEVVAWCFEQIKLHSPVLKGTYKASHRIFADGVEVSKPEDAATAREVVIASTVPYARKIEKWKSPDGVYQAVAAMAMSRFGNIAKVKFRFVEVNAPGSMLQAWAEGHGKAIRHERKRASQRRKDLRQPAIVINGF